MDNYALAQENARRYFLAYDQKTFQYRKGVCVTDSFFCLPFLDYNAKISKQTGCVTLLSPGEEEKEAGYGEALSIYDWLCDQKPGAVPSGEYCPVHSLPGVMVRGKGLTMTGGKLPAFWDTHPDALHQSCLIMGGEPIELGDMGYKLPLFSDLSVLLKFYHSDEDFPPSLTLLWDKNILDFIKYETVYFVAGCLFHRLRELSGCKE